MAITFNGCGSRVALCTWAHVFAILDPHSLALLTICCSLYFCIQVDVDIDRVGLKKLRVGLMQQRVGLMKQRVGLMQQRVGLRKQRVGLLEIRKCDVRAKLGTRRRQGGSAAERLLDIVNHKRGLIDIEGG